ncbi:MAG TPA: hypothetical protein VGM69_22860 [Chloroflexota bacterium]|jgi:hypothetical protein
MAKGKLRIRQRGSRQQWAQARNLKLFGGEEGEPGQSEPGAPPVPDRPASGHDVVQSLRCGLCGLVAEQRLRDGGTLVLIPYVLCISCDEVRCDACWAAEDDPCADADEHEFLEVKYQRNGAVQTADFGEWNASSLGQR